MKAGLLICDHVSIEYQDEFGDYPDMFANLFPSFDWILYDVCNGEFPKDLDDCDVYMATGSKYSVYDDFVWIGQLKKLLVELYQEEKYFVGFCFGHQLIGEALGGKVGKSPNGWCVGVHHFEVCKNEVWMIPTKEHIGLLMMCQDQILQLPMDTTILAKSASCPAAMIRVGRTFLGIQAHPEFSKEYDKMLMETRMNKMGDAVATKGIESLSMIIDSATIQEWILQFLKPSRAL